MTAPTLPAAPVEDTTPRPGSRAARMLMPRSVDVVKDLASDYGVCTHPVSLRRTDLDTGQTEVIDLPCGATQETKCPACATKARRLRQQQIREGWHRDDEPDPGPQPATEDQKGLIVLRAHFEFAREDCVRTAQWDQVADLDDAIAELDEQITTQGLRGRPAPPHTTDDDQETGDGKRRVRSTRRRQDAPDLPRLPVQNRTIGRTFHGNDGQVFRPSMFLTLTLDSYGRVRTDGTPVDPDTYDYRRAAWDAVHFPRLLDRFWQNLRRAVGWNVQYAGAVEPQRRLAPHAHFAIRGTIPRALVRQVAAATYHQVWWPPVGERTYQPGQVFEWNTTGGYTDPTTGHLLPSWDDALDLVDADPDAQPVHVVRFGSQLDAKGVLAGTKDANRCVGYITKYLTKQAADCHETTTARQRAHLERLWQELRHTPCSDRCANWLLYGVQPKKARAGLKPGNCKSKVHKRSTLGIGGRRVLISRQWSGKTLADHRADRREWVKALLGVTTDAENAPTVATAVRHAWELARPTDPDVAPLGHRVLRAISERIQWRAQLDAARRIADPPDASATVNGSESRREAQ